MAPCGVSLGALMDPSVGCPEDELQRRIFFPYSRILALGLCWRRWATCRGLPTLRCGYRDHRCGRMAFEKRAWKRRGGPCRHRWARGPVVGKILGWRVRENGSLERGDGYGVTFTCVHLCYLPWGVTWETK